jgi:hypothetical protein
MKAISAGKGLVARTLRPVSSVVVTTPKEIDLAHPPTRDSLRVPDGAASEVWMNGDLRTFAVEVGLPGGHVFHSDADVVVVLCPDEHSDPERIVIRRPATRRDEADQLLREYSEWTLPVGAIPSDAVDEWRDNVGGVTQGGHHYSTRVFTPDRIGVVQLEFQMAHHVREGDFVVTIHFTWDDSFDPGEPESVDRPSHHGRGGDEDRGERDHRPTDELRHGVEGDEGAHQVAGVSERASLHPTADGRRPIECQDHA